METPLPTPRPETHPATHGGFYVQRDDGVMVLIPPEVELAGDAAVADYVAAYGTAPLAPSAALSDAPTDALSDAASPPQE